MKTKKLYISPIAEVLDVNLASLMQAPVFSIETQDDERGAQTGKEFDDFDDADTGFGGLWED